MDDSVTQVQIPTFDSLRSLWVGLTLDVLVLFSLYLQFVLALTAPLRKHSRKRAIPFVWLPYLLAILYANYAMGLIPDDTVEGGRTGNLRVFWAPFLILHLGGPNTITALSLADNEFWLRYTTHLLTISYTFSRVFLRSLLVDNDLWVPTLVMFFAGVIKYTERLICLFYGRLTKFRESCLQQSSRGVNYARFAETYLSSGESNINGEASTTSTHQQSHSNPEPDETKLTQVQIVKDAYNFFCEFKGLFVNTVFTPSQRDKTTRYFRSRDAKDAFRVCEVELNFAYDIFYTKAILINMIKWPFHNILSLGFQIASLVLWIRVDKSSFNWSSVRATDALLGGSIALEMFSLFTFLMSDWSIAKLRLNNAFFSNFYEKLLLLKQRPEGLVKMFFGRWSEQIPQLNLIALTLTKKWKLVLRLSKVSAATVCVAQRRFTDKVGTFIFNELKYRSCWTEKPEDIDAELISCTGGAWLIERLDLEYKEKGLESKSFSRWIIDLEYEESLILWHVATQLCYAIEEDDDRKDEHRELSKTISDYLLYLLILQPTMMPGSSQVVGPIIFQDTCAEAERFFKRVLFPSEECSKDKKEQLLRACVKILGVNTDVVSPREIKGCESRSVLFEACILAKELQRLKDKQINKWEIIGKVWAGMLVYAAGECSPIEHVEKLSNGGELLTLVWLLMTHLGLGEQYL